MKKRLRKKLHLNEFAEYGVEFTVEVYASTSEKQFADMMEKFLSEFVEKNGLGVWKGVWNCLDRRASLVLQIGRGRHNAEQYISKIQGWFIQQQTKFTYFAAVIDLWH